MEKAVIYARVSTREQEETGYSLGAQTTLLSEYAKKNNLEVKEVFTASESASGKKDRQVFYEMLSYVEKENITHIICEKTDRLTRNPKDASVINDWINNGTQNKVHFVKEAFIADKNTKAHEGLVWNMKISIAKFYTDNLSEEVRKGNEEKAKQGWLPRKAKFGYRTDGESGHKIHVPNEETAPLVQRMFQLYATGLYSIELLTQKMFEDGLRSVSGKKIPKSNIARYLSDPFYYGEFEWDGKIYKGKHETLITKNLFDEVQKIKLGNNNPKYSKHEYLFKGLLTCHSCSKTIYWEEHKSTPYGHCGTHKQCTDCLPWYVESVIDTQVSNLFSQLRINNERFAKWLVVALKESNASESEYRTQSAEALQRELEKIEMRLNRLYEDRLDGRIDTTFYDNRASILQADKDALLEKMNLYIKAPDKSKEIGLTMYELSQRAPELYQKATVEEKRRLMKLVFGSLKLSKGIVQFTYTPAFQILADAIEASNSSEALQNSAQPITVFELQDNTSTEPRLEDLETVCPNLLASLSQNRWWSSSA